MLACMEMGHRLEVPVLCICPSGSFPEVAADGGAGEKRHIKVAGRRNTENN